MPLLYGGRENLENVIQQISLSSSDNDFFDQLIPAIKAASQDGRGYHLLQSLAQFCEDREAEIEKLCNFNHQEFTSSVNQLLKIREKAGMLTSEILDLNYSIQASTENLAQQKRALVESRSVRQSINETSEALTNCLDVLRLVNQVHDLLGRKNHYAALRALDELQNIHIRQVMQFKIADVIQSSIPATKKLIADAVMADLTTWLFRIRETSQFLGEVAFYATEQRRARQKERGDKVEYLKNSKLNSAIELVSDEDVEFDILDNEDVQVDFTPLFECLHIHSALGQSDKFRAEYSATRRQQKELLLLTSITLTDPEEPSLSELLEGIAGFAIVEKATMMKAPGLRTQADVDELWESLCRAAVDLISGALHEIENAEILLRVKGVIALFIKTMVSWGYNVRSLDAFLLVLFEKYAELLQTRFSEDFQEIVLTDDYMPMPINSLDEYDKVVNVTWYTPDKIREDMKFPCVLPFSQMYPLSCIDIRNFLNQFYFFSDDHFQQSKVIDDTLKTSLDKLLSDKVCRSLVEKLNSQYLGQIVQILINMEHFEIACQQLELLLVAARSPGSIEDIHLGATEKFRANKKAAEKRIFELVNSKVDDLVDTADYHWESNINENEPSNYIQTLTQYLSNIMTTVLLSLPAEIKELLYFNALSHASTKILSLPLSTDVKHISPIGVAIFARDVKYLSDFVDSLENPILQENLDELRQTVALMQAENTDDYYDNSTRNKKYGRVNALNGPLLLEKLATPNLSRQEKFTTFSKFGYL